MVELYHRSPKCLHGVVLRDNFTFYKPMCESGSVFVFRVWFNIHLLNVFVQGHVDPKSDVIILSRDRNAG
jgi:hypothetical protein